MFTELEKYPIPSKDGFSLGGKKLILDMNYFRNFEDYSLNWMNWILFQLCKHYKIPTKSDVWDKYTDEELLVEYYAIRFDSDDEEMKKFEGIIGGMTGGDDDIYDWFDKQIDKNKKEIQEKEAEMEDDLSFSPDTMG